MYPVCSVPYESRIYTLNCQVWHTGVRFRVQSQDPRGQVQDPTGQSQKVRRRNQGPRRETQDHREQSQEPLGSSQALDLNLIKAPVRRVPLAFGIALGSESCGPRRPLPWNGRVCRALHVPPPPGNGHGGGEGDGSLWCRKC